MTELYEDIYDYLENVNDKKFVTVKDQDELIHKVHAHTKLEKADCKLILDNIFQEIRKIMLDGNKVSIDGFGKIFIAGKITNCKTHVAAKYIPDRNLIKKINDDR